MSSIQHLAVFPKLPTTLADQIHLDLPGYDIWFTYINNLLVVPTELDVSRFQEALSRVLQLYPHAAGKFRYIDERWTIELTNTAIPLNIEYKLDSSSDSFLNGDAVHQEDLSTFIDIQPMGANVFNDSTPLLFVKLTFFQNETCVGVAWQHSLGDGTALSHFLHTLSQFYQGLSSEFATPSLTKDHFPTPSDSVVADIWPRIPHLHEACDFGSFPTSVQSFEHVNWRIDNRDIEELRSALTKKQSGPPLSRQDCITTYLVAVMNTTRSDPLRIVRNTTSYRHVKAPFIAENAAGNFVMEVFADVPADMAGIATAVRSSLVRCRDSDYIHRWLLVTSHLKFEAFNACKAFPPAGADDELVVNSFTTINWCSAHFGCPDGTRFHTDGVMKNFVRVNRSNPVKKVDGVWQACQSVDIAVGVAPEVKPILLQTLARGVRFMLHHKNYGFLTNPL